MKLILKDGEPIERGFNLKTGKYIPLDCDDWIDRHNIREVGKKNGSQNLPSSYSKTPDSVHTEIYRWINQRALDCKNDVAKFINEKIATLNDLGQSWKNKINQVEFNNTIDQKVQDMENNTKKAIGDIYLEEQKYLNAANNLSDFKKENNLTRNASYPENQIVHWLWVPAAAIVESFTSANLLGNVMQGGTIQGWLVAILLTGGNILLGVLAGWALRSKNSNRRSNRYVSLLVTIVICLLALWWNLLAGHARDVFAEAGVSYNFELVTNAFAIAFERILADPVLSSLQSAMLALVGAVVFILTMVKRYFVDDVYPGYGGLDRELKSSFEMYQSELNYALDRLFEERDSAQDYIRGFSDRFTIDKNAWDSNRNVVDSTLQNYSENIKQFDKDLMFLVNAYRDANIRYRTEPPPEYFEHEEHIEEDLLTVPVVGDIEIIDWIDFANNVRERASELEDVYKRCFAKFPKLNKPDFG